MPYEYRALIIDTIAAPVDAATATTLPKPWNIPVTTGDVV